MASVDGHTEATHVDQGQFVSERLIGSSNESFVLICDREVTALIDSGSMVSTVSHSFYLSLSDRPILHSLDSLLDVSVADGSKLTYLGYIEANVVVPFLSDFNLSVPLLVVPDTDFNQSCPAIIGTNVLRPLRSKLSSAGTTDPDVPEEWQLALDSLNYKTFMVKACSRKPISVKPYETVVVNGFSRNIDSEISEIVTETTQPSGYTVCPRVMKLEKTDYHRIPVKICNMTAKALSIKPRSILCHVSEVKVVDTIASEIPSSSQEKPSSSFIDELGIQIDSSDLTQEQLLRVRQVLGNWEHIFSKGLTDLGRTDIVKHKIQLTDDRPFKQPYRRIPPGMYEEVRQHLKDMLAAGAIRESTSPYSSNVVLVRKKDNSLRFCIDYRTLNSKTKKDAYMLPRFDDTIDTLAGSKFFTKLDLRSGYWQVEMEEEDKEKTAFSVGNLGFYECERMSFGLCNAPGTFQRLMEKCMGELHLRECLIFIDDILIFSKTFEEHIQRLEAVFERLAQHNLKLKPSKCEFFKTSVTYLGHLVSSEGIRTDPEKTAAIKNWQPPGNIKELRHFLGFAGYYRRFVKDFSSIAQPLNALLEGHVTHKVKKRGKAKRNRAKKPAEWVWGDEQQNAFLTLKDKLMNPPVLAYADYSRNFTLHVDASGQGLGAVLYQLQDGEERVIAYASRSLRPSERKYPAHKLEFLALKWAVTDKFHDYLMGASFDVVTDNNPLTYVLTSAKLDATGHRWVAALANYNFTIRYRSGKQNIDADGLSRLPPDTVQAICQAITANVPFVECLSGKVAPQTADEGVSRTDNFSKVDWAKEQRLDPILARVIYLQSSSFRPREGVFRKELPEVQKYFREWRKLHVKDNTLYRTAALDGQAVEQLVVPENFRARALRGIHDDLGHQGKEKTLWLAKQRFYWPGLERDIERKIQSCDRCIRRKTPTKPVAQLNPISSSYPMELVCIDFLSLEQSKGGFEHILVITDHFTRYAQAVPCRNQTAQTTAKALYENFFRFYSFPARLHSDQGRNFESRVIKELCTLCNTQKTRTTPYHAMGNGSAERFNQTLLKMLGTLENSQKSDWKSYVAPLVQAYNATKNDATGFSPHFLMFGWHPRLSVDAYLGITPVPDEASAGPQTYGKKLRTRMQFAYDVASEHAGKVAQRNKAYYDQGKQEAVLEEGDRVLVRNVGLKGKQKLADKWEEQPYIVCDRPDPDLPVYRVKPENGSKIRTLHRNLLLPFNCIPGKWDEKAATDTSQRLPKTRRVTRASRRADSNSESDQSSGEESSQSSVYIIPQRRGQPAKPKSQRGHPARTLESPMSSGRTPSDGPESTGYLSRHTTRTEDQTRIPSGSNTRSLESGADVPDTVGMESNQFVPDLSGMRDIENPSPDPDQQSGRTIGADLDPGHDISLVGANPDPVMQVTGPVASFDTVETLDALPVSPRRSRRERKAPDRFGQWVYSQNVWNFDPESDFCFT